MEFTYSTKSENQKGLIGLTHGGQTFVNVYPEYSMDTSNIYEYL